MKVKTTLLALLLAGFSFAQIQFPQVSSKAEIEQTIGLTKIEIDYSRPNLNNRTAFGGIVPFGEVWRTGANSNTTIEIGTDVLVEGKSLTKGEYSIYTIPNQKSWDVIFYKSTDNWGNPKDWNEENVVLKINVPTINLHDKLETFTIGFENVTTDNAILFLAWDKTKVDLKITAPTKENVVRNIENQLNDNSSARDFYGAANFYFNNNLDLSKAKQWIDKAIKLSPKAPQHFLELQSKIISSLK